jgi:NADPH2:quinone reductase
MKAIVAKEFGGPEVLQIQDLPDPEVGAGQVRVKVHAVGVNPFDTYMRTGTYAIKPPLPYSPGADAAGVVDRIGSGVANVSIGDRVYVAGTAQHKAYGAYASMVVCDQHQVHPLPPGVGFAQGAAVNVPYVTAWRALFGRANARAGDTVLIHGASGGVGIAATQLARAAGLIVIGTAGSADGLDIVKKQGAHHVVSHRQDGYLGQVASLTAGRGPDLIVEMLANVNLDHDLSAIAPGGRIVIVGNRGRVEIDARKIMTKDCSIFGMALWGIPPGEVARAHQAIGAGLATGALSPVIGVELPLSEAARAHVMVMEPGAKGKIVLIP